MATFRSSSKPWTIHHFGVSSSGPGETKSLRSTICIRTLSELSMAVPDDLAVALANVRVADGEQPALDLDGVVHRGPRPDPPVVDIAAVRRRAGWC